MNKQKASGPASQYSTEIGKYNEAVGIAMCMAGEPPDALKDAEAWAKANQESVLAVLRGSDE